MSALDQPLSTLAEAVKAGAASAESLVRESLDRIARARALNAFTFVSNDAALEAARAIDQRRARGETLGPLAGVPIALKDLLCTVDAPTTCASRVLLRNVDGEPNAA